MAETIVVELKSDLESVYKIGGDLLNLIMEKDLCKESMDIKDLIDLVKFRLEDICGTLQKDIFNCNYLITKDKLNN